MIGIMSKGPQKRSPQAKISHQFDWAILEEEWQKEWKATKVKKIDFLRARGISCGRNTAGNIKTRDWEDRLLHLMEQDSLKDATPVETKPLTEKDTVDQAVQKVSSEFSWNTVWKWRSNQGNLDWNTADKLRVHVNLIMKNNLEMTTSPEGKVEFRSKLKPAELRHLAAVVADIQRVQRLALGMSTENVGLETAMAMVGGEPGSRERELAEGNLKSVTPLPPQIIITLPSNGKEVVNK